MAIQSVEVDPNNMTSMDSDKDDVQVSDDENMELKTANCDPPASRAISAQRPEETSQHASTKRKVFDCDNTLLKQPNYEHNTDVTSRRIVHAKRTSKDSRDNLITGAREPATKDSVMSGDSAIWTLSNTSATTNELMDNTHPLQDKRAVCSADSESTSARTPNSAGPSTMLDKDVTAQPQISVNSTPEELISNVVKTKQEASEHKQTHSMERVSAHIPTVDLRELAGKLKKLELQTSRANKKRAQKQKEREVYQKVDHMLENLSKEELRELFTSQDNDGDNLLMIAIIEGCSALAKSLIRLVPSAVLLDVRNKLGQTALHLTVITHQRRMIRKLVLAGANLQSLDFLGNTPLHVACSNNDLDSVVSLTKLVTCLECPEKNKRQSLVVPQPSELYNFKGQTCLHIAAQNGFTHLVKYLVETQLGADVNAPERLCGKTALHIAAELGNMDLVEYLLSLDQTDQDAVTYARLSALDLAVGRGQDRVGNVLEQAGVTAQMTQQVMPEEEDQEEGEEERNMLTLQDFQCSVIANSTRQEPLEYDDLCIGGKPLQSLQSFK